MNERFRGAIPIVTTLVVVAAFLLLAYAFNQINEIKDWVSATITLQVDIGTLVGGVLVGSAALYSTKILAERWRPTAPSDGAPSPRGPESGGGPPSDPVLPEGALNEKDFRDRGADGPDLQLWLIYEKLARLEAQLIRRDE